MKPFISLFALTLFCTNSMAQTFQWAKAGGSTTTMQGTPDYNNILEIETDEAGNIYALGRIGTSNAQVDGHFLKGYTSAGIGATPNVLLTSFTKDGTYRWSKVMGSGTGRGIGLEYSNGKVYLSGNIFNLDSTHFDQDTVYYHQYNGNLPKYAFLIQYDTLGNFQWLQMPGVDTIPLGGPLERGYWLDADNSGNIHWLIDLLPGDLPGTPYTITQKGTYVLKYSSIGSLLKVVKLDIKTYEEPKGSFIFDGSYNQGGFLYNPNIKQYYLGGSLFSHGKLTINSDTIEGFMYVAAFDENGQFLWKKESNNNPYPSELSKMKMDKDGSLYICGSAKNGAVIFDNQVFTSPSIHGAPYMMKLDGNGNLIWSKIGVTKAVSLAQDMVISKNEVAMTGYHGSLYFQGSNDQDTLRAVPNQGYDAFIARFDKQSGDLVDLVSTTTNFGGASYGYALAADADGGYYLGGNFDQLLFLAGDTLAKPGSQRGFFIAKYACNIPQANFSVGMAHPAYTFTYTGTPADSVIWDFGDGFGPVKGDSTFHSYSSPGTYRVCATAYDACRDTSYCENVTVSVVGQREWNMPSLSISPNPATTFVNIEIREISSSQSYSLELRDLRGALLYRTPVSSTTTLDVFKWPQGLYQVNLYRENALLRSEKLLIK